MTKLSSQFKTHDYFCFRLHAAFMKCYPESDKTTVYELFYPHCLSLLRLISSRMLPPPSSLPLHPFSPHMKRWVALSPHTAICFVESPRDTLAYLSSATQTSKSVLASQRDGEAPPGSRRRLQSTRCSPGIKYPFR